MFTDINVENAESQIRLRRQCWRIYIENQMLKISMRPYNSVQMSNLM